jgi:hypothetical protein
MDRDHDDLAQALAADDAVGAILRDLRDGARRPIDRALADRHIAGALAASGDSALPTKVVQLRSPRRHALRMAAPSLAAAAALTGAILALGAADVLPGRTQTVVARLASYVGLDLPDDRTGDDAPGGPPATVEVPDAPGAPEGDDAPAPPAGDGAERPPAVIPPVSTTGPAAPTTTRPDAAPPTTLPEPVPTTPALPPEAPEGGRDAPAGAGSDVRPQSVPPTTAPGGRP